LSLIYVLTAIYVMKSFESWPSPEQTTEIPEAGKFNLEKSLLGERTILEKLRGKAKKVAGVFLLVSSLTAGCMARGGYAEVPRPAATTETQENAPDWVARAQSGETSWEEGGTLYAVGMASGIRNISLLRSTASSRARANLLHATGRSEGPLRGSTVPSLWQGPNGTMYALAEMAR
jgi:hypothetical protein